MTDKVTVVVPVYKVEQYIHRCVDSILAQTYENIEVVLVDDGSPDGCPAICDEYAIKDNRVIVIHKKNGGLSDARNAGTAVATGKYITYVDSDDWISNNCVQVMIDSIKGDDAADLAIVETILTNGNPKENSTDNTEGVARRCYSAEEALRVILNQKEFNTSAWGKLYSTSLMKANPFTKGILYEDFDLIYRLIIQTHKVVFNSSACYYYFQRPESILHENVNDKHLIIIDIAARMKTEICDTYPGLRQAAVNRYVFSNLMLLSKVILKDEYRYMQKRIRHNIIKLGPALIFNREMLNRDRKKVILLWLGLGVYRKLYIKKVVGAENG